MTPHTRSTLSVLAAAVLLAAALVGGGRRDPGLCRTPSGLARRAPARA